MNRFFRLTLILLCLTLLFSAGLMAKKTKTNKGKDTKAAKVEAPKPVVPQADILAEYDGGLITKQDLEAKITKIPPQAQSRYKTVEGQTQILDMMAVEDIFFRKAKDMNLLTDPAVQDKINNAKKQVLLQEYYKRNVTDKVTLPELEKQAYYEQNKKDFFVAPYVTIKYLQPKDEDNAKKAMAELKKGNSFKQVADKYNINTYAKNVDGTIKNIRLNGYLPGIGNDPELDNIINVAAVDTLHYLGPQQTSTGWSIIQVTEKIEGKQRPYLECEAEVDQRLRPKQEAELLKGLMDKQKLAYHVVVDTVALNNLNLREPEKNTDLANVTLVTASDPSLTLTGKDVLDKYAKLSPQEQMMYLKNGGANQIVEQELNRSLMGLDASRDKSYDDYLAQNEDFKQASRVYVLQEAYKKLVVEKIVITPQDTRDYYDTHLETFTTPASRKIVAVWCKDDKTAGKARKKLASAIRKDSRKAIAAVIKKYSTKPEQDTLDNIYNNGIFPGIGSDKALCDLVWSTPVGSVSPVAKSVKGDILCFAVLTENQPATKSYTEVEQRLQGQLKKDKEKTQMEAVTEQLFTQYGMKKYPEKLVLKLSADELFEMADGSARQRKYKDAIVYYDQIIQFYPNGTDDYKAAFMKAFLVSEEMEDKEQGLSLFKDFLKKYPAGELNESAQYMIDEMEGRHPQLEESIPENDKD
jgi:peptidyl-prolyl cis-trans isomerase C